MSLFPAAVKRGFRVPAGGAARVVAALNDVAARAAAKRLCAVRDQYSQRAS